ncbi:MAG: YchF/TatD family DNA exonuclease [Desulfobulbaceae bacterium]|nr:YchF/TatD family DNA exonuclease [Desulfobulbaceae bacterium]
MKNTIKQPILSPGKVLIDSHCHLDMDDYRDDLDAIITDAREAGVARIITIGIDFESSEKAVQIADRYSNVFATIGVHPHAAARASEKGYAKLARLAHNEKVIGYGEIGLDYAKKYAPEDVQLKTFVRQLRLAKELYLPVVIHDRDAHEDTLRILQENAPFPQGGVMHCFSGDSILADQVIKLGFYISIPGIITFKNAAVLQDVVRGLPLEHIILETDGPFLAPAPFRGKKNKPEFLTYTAQMVADLKNKTLDDVAFQTSANTAKLFNLPSEGVLS